MPPQLEEEEMEELQWLRCENQDLWQRLEAVNKGHQVTFMWSKGHSGISWNEGADALAAGHIKFSSGSQNA